MLPNQAQHTTKLCAAQPKALSMKLAQMPLRSEDSASKVTSALERESTTRRQDAPKKLPLEDQEEALFTPRLPTTDLVLEAPTSPTALTSLLSSALQETLKLEKDPVQAIQLNEKENVQLINSQIKLVILNNIKSYFHLPYKTIPIILN